MNLTKELRKDVAERVNLRLAESVEGSVEEWELKCIVARIPDGDFPMIEGGAPVVADLESKRGRIQIQFLEERVFEYLLVMREGERGVLEGRAGDRRRKRLPLVDRGSLAAEEQGRRASWRVYWPDWWDEELESRSERLRPLQQEALLVVFGDKRLARPCPAEAVPGLLKAIAREELPAGQHAWMWVPEATYRYATSVKNVFLRGERGPTPPPPQLSFLDAPHQGTMSPRGRLQRLRELAAQIMEQTDCNEGEAVGYLLCDITILYRPMTVEVEDRRDGPVLKIELRSLDVPLSVIRDGCRDEVGVGHARGRRKRSPWPSVIFDFVQARSPRQGRRDWRCLWGEFKRDPRHAACSCVKNKKLTEKGGLESFRQTYFREETKRFGPPKTRDKHRELEFDF